MHLSNAQKNCIMEKSHTIEVVFATPSRQTVVRIEVAAGANARLAAMQSELDRYFPELDLATVPLGVFGERVADEYQVNDGDRVELYRELELDPKEARRRRAGQGTKN